jgi:hypothetical protein
MTNIKELKAQYEKDVTDHGREKANSMWQHNDYGGCWTTFYTTEVPIWYTNVEYRRKRSAYLAKPPAGHKHAELMAQYAEDAKTHEKPWTQWEAYCTKPPRNWFELKSHPSWADDHDYRRKPKQHTIVLNTEQLKELVFACSFPGWENEDFVSAKQILTNALGERA